MEYRVLGWPPDAPTLDLHHERFAYAGKFVMSDTGKAVARDGEALVAAVAFSPDRTDGSTLRLRYVTVRRDRQGEGIGPRLCRLIADRATARDFETALIAVNNPFAYVAAYRAGFAYVGETTGMAELVLTTDADRGRERYRAGLEVYADRDLAAPAREFVAEKRTAPVPETVPSPA